ncbi:xylulokinase [Sphingomonas sp. SUN039]|uniref:xylulokinase n=1 Tax=Sphingomonas sp. SUN039 TaxID=2937787 RepID=UPI0021640E6F|nr:xylulokinase [Sphingomonas sp. SUN039]UVO53776.1 xylulokinase [Sphingomonas sp. SUN039]
MYLGIDVGTSCVKAVLVDDDDAVVDQASATLAISRLHPLWSEQHPADWWAATNRAVASLDPNLRAQVKSVGLAGQMHGATLLDKNMQALRPAILWNDGRSGAECADLEASVADLGQITGNRAMPGFTAPKLQWVRTHEPEVFAATKTVLLPKDYVRLRMTGDTASDMSDSAGTLWLDVAARDWSDTMLTATGLDRSHMPTLFEGTAVTGQLRAELAEAWGMTRVPVVAGGGDNAAGAIGVGVVRPGDAFLSLGTSGVLFLANDGYRPNPAGGVHSFCHALPNRWHQMSVILSAASCVDWAARLCGVENAGSLFALVEARGMPTTTEMFLPYLSGERTPHNDPDAKGVMFGLTHETDAAALGQAVLEGVAFAFRDGLDALLDSGATLDTITVIGGGARSAYWGKILASALGRPLIYRDGGEVGPAFGAARLARLGLGTDAIEDVCTPPPIIDIVEPDERLTDRFAARRPAFRHLYSTLKSSFTETA